MKNSSTYKAGVAVALGTGLFLLWGVLALGVIGREGDRADLMYLGVLSIALLGALISRGKPEGLAKAMIGTAAAQAAVTVIALLMGKQDDPVTSVLEIVGLNSMFIGLFLGSAWLFRKAMGNELSHRAHPTTSDG